MGKKVNPMQDLKRDLFEKSTPFGKSLDFNLLDDQVDKLSFILSPKFRMWERNLSRLQDVI